MWLGTKNCITTTLGYIYMTTNTTPGSNFLFVAQRAPYRPHLLCYVHTALAVFGIYSMFLDVFSPAPFFSIAQTLCTPFACSGHRNRHLEEGSYLCAALSTMTSALTDLTSTSAASAPCTSSRGSLMSSLSSLWAWLFPADGITRIAPHIRFYSRSRVWAAHSDMWYCCGRPAHLSHWEEPNICCLTPTPHFPGNYAALQRYAITNKSGKNPCISTMNKFGGEDWVIWMLEASSPLKTTEKEKYSSCTWDTKVRNVKPRFFSQAQTYQLTTQGSNTTLRLGRHCVSF